MKKDITNFSKKLESVMANIGNYIDINMSLIESIECIYIQRATYLKELVTKYCSNLSKISEKSHRFKGNELFIDKYIQKASSQREIAKKAYETINRYIINGGIENKFYHQFNFKLLKTALENIFAEIYNIEKRDSIIAKSLVNKTSKSISIPNDLYDKCLAMVVCGSCEYIEKFAIEKLAKLAHEIFNFSYQNINYRYAKMMEDISEFLLIGLVEPIKIDFNTDDNLNFKLLTQVKNSWNPCLEIKNQMFIKNTEIKKSFAAYLKEEVSLINTQVIETSISECIKNENFDLNTVSTYFLNFQNDLKNEIIKKGYIYALELISLTSITSPLAILDIKSDSNQRIENQSSTSNNKKEIQFQFKKRLSSKCKLRNEDRPIPLEKSTSTSEAYLSINGNVDEDNYNIVDLEIPKTIEKKSHESINELPYETAKISSLSEKMKRTAIIIPKQEPYDAINGEPSMEEKETYDAIGDSNNQEILYENDMVEEEKKLYINYSHPVNKSDFSKDFKNKIDVGEHSQNLKEADNKVKDNAKIAEIIEDLKETNTKLPHNLIIGKAYKILKKYFNFNSGVDESCFIEGDPCILLGVVENTNFCMIRLLRLNKEVCVPIEYIVEKNIPPKIEIKNHKVLPEPGKGHVENEIKEKPAQKSIYKVFEEEYE